MSQARDFADSFSAVSTGRRNLMINGAMQVAQRATSVTGVSDSETYRSIDRFKFSSNGAGPAFTESQSSTAPDGFSNSFKVDCTTADTSLDADAYIIVGQGIEGQNLQHLKKGTSGALQLTASFWVRSSKTGTYTCELYDNDNTRHIAKTYSISSADTWEHKTISFNGDTSGSLSDDNGRSLTLNFWIGAGTNFTSGTFTEGTWASVTNANRVSSSNVNIADSTSNEWYITGVQLEVGNSASPFEHRSHAEELQLAKRYYQEYENPALRGVCNLASGGARMGMMLPVEMRANPTLSVESTGSTGHFAIYDGTTSNNAFSGFSATYLKPFRIEMDCSATSSNLVIGRAVVCYDSTVYRTKFKISAEL